MKLNNITTAAANGNGRQSLADALLFPPAQAVNDTPTDEKEAKEIENRTWLFNRAVELGAIEMAGQQPKPGGFYVNWTTIVALIAIVGFIGGLYTYTWNIAYQKGIDDAEKKEILQRLSKNEDDTKRMKALQEYTSGAATGHKPEASNTNTQRSK